MAVSQLTEDNLYVILTCLVSSSTKVSSGSDANIAFVRVAFSL